MYVLSAWFRIYLKHALMSTVISMANNETVIPIYPVVCKSKLMFFTKLRTRAEQHSKVSQMGVHLLLSKYQWTRWRWPLEAATWRTFLPNPSVMVKGLPQTLWQCCKSLIFLRQAQHKEISACLSSLHSLVQSRAAALPWRWWVWSPAALWLLSGKAPARHNLRGAPTFSTQFFWWQR